MTRAWEGWPNKFVPDRFSVRKVLSRTEKVVGNKEQAVRENRSFALLWAEHIDPLQRFAYLNCMLSFWWSYMWWCNACPPTGEAEAETGGQQVNLKPAWFLSGQSKLHGEEPLSLAIEQYFVWGFCGYEKHGEWSLFSWENGIYWSFQWYLPQSHSERGFWDGISKGKLNLEVLFELCLEGWSVIFK